MSDNELDEKRAKALRYAAEPERFQLKDATFVVRSNHGVREVKYREGTWRCVCEFYRQQGTCSHILAVRELLRKSGLKQ